MVRKAFLVALPALTLPFVIRFAVTEGVATATPASSCRGGRRLRSAQRVASVSKP